MVELLEAHYGEPQWEGPLDPLDSMVTAILSQSTSDTNRDMAWRGLRKSFPSWRQVAEADPSDIAAAIRPGGLANQKSRRIRDFVLWVKERFGEYSLDRICTMNEQEAYALFCGVEGIGVKTVAVTLLFACGRDVFPVDTHVNRISCRVGLVAANSPPHKTHARMQPHVPPGRCYSLHVNFIRLGREICRRVPRCHVCPLCTACDYARTAERQGLPVA